jgi:FkbM family methyltransferase
MASVNSPIRNFIKPILYKLLGTKGYKYFQYLGKLKDIQNKLVEEPEIELLDSLIKPNDEVIDIGANYAYYTERMSSLCPQGKVFAFEPIPFTYDVAAKIVKKLKLHNVELFQKGVGQKNETLRFSVPTLDFGSISAGQAHIKGRNNDNVKGSEYYVSDKTAEFDCDVVSIDSFLLEKLTKLTFIKIDIEGAEHFALKGMAKTLEKFKPVILIEIVPLFLESFGIPKDDFQNNIEHTLGYQLFKYNTTQKKLFLHTGPIDRDMNYILIHKDRVTNFSNLIG